MCILKRYINRYKTGLEPKIKNIEIIEIENRNFDSTPDSKLGIVKLMKLIK